MFRQRRDTVNYVALGTVQIMPLVGRLRRIGLAVAAVAVLGGAFEARHRADDSTGVTNESASALASSSVDPRGVGELPLVDVSSSAGGRTAARPIAPRTLTAGTPIDDPGAASLSATRGTAVQIEPPPTDPACQPPAGVPASARQVVVVHPTGSFAVVDLLERAADVGSDAAGSDDVWVCTLRSVPGRVGRNGVRLLAQRKSGDGTTPAGVFPLGTMSAPNGDTFQYFGNGTNPGVTRGWHQVQPGDCWDATGGDVTYNTLTSRGPANCTGDDEYLPYVTGAYSRAALIGANMGPDRSGDEPGEAPRAAAIFLHRFSYDATGDSQPTSGCVSLAGPDLDVVLRALVPGEAWFVIA